MADDSLRRLMARIAKGLPVLVVGVAAPFVLSGCLFGGGDCGDNGEETIVIAASSSSDGGAGDAGAAGADCYTLCRESSSRPASKEVLTCTDMGATIECTYGYFCEGGRNPERQFSAKASALDSDPRRSWLTQLAIAELVSVPAFHELADALSRHGAPAELVERSRASADDEARHAKIAFRLATRDGTPLTLRVEAPRERGSSLRDVAVHNAKEGCVREAYAALEAAWQAHHADDDETRAAFGTIARDEARHARLSLDIDIWARTVLDDEGGRALDAARAAGLRDLRDEVAGRCAPAGLGLPTDGDAHALIAMIA